MDESLAMARIYVDAGVSRVVATPHVIPGTKLKWKPKEICDQVDHLNQCLKEENIPLTVAPGMEVALDTEILTLIDQNCLLPLGNSKYVLIEVPFQRLPLGWNQILFALQLRGFQILLAHPERCDHLMKKRAFFDDMIYSGAYLQVEWGSFLGHHGPEVKSQAEYLAQIEAATDNGEKARGILEFTSRYTRRVIRWKWRQALLARELGMNDLFFFNTNVLLTRPEKRQDTFQLIDTRFQGQTLSVLNMLAPEHRTTYLNWLIGWNRVDDTQTVWQEIAKTDPPDPVLATKYVHFLVGHNKIEPAAAIWQELTGIDGVTNSGFEKKAAHTGFDWRYSAARPDSFGGKEPLSTK